MKALLTILALITLTATLKAEEEPTPTPTPTPPAITLPVQVPVQVLSVQVQETDTVTPEVVLIDLTNREIGVKFSGIESRQVITGPAYDAIVATFWDDFASAIVAALYPSQD